MIKKAVAAILAAIMIAMSLSGVAYAHEYILDETFIIGNIEDSDASVNMKDIFRMKLYILGLDSGYEKKANEDAGDLDADGKISMKDLFMLKSYVAGYIKKEALENGFQIQRLTVGDAGIEEFCIVIPEDADSETNANYAATELKKYIAIATGVSLEIVNGEDDAAAEHKIIFHSVDLYSEYGQELGTDGYRYTVCDGNLEIYGTLRGNMYAVYDILEDILGYDFFFDTETFIRKSRTVSIAAGTDVTYIPKLSYRYCDQGYSSSYAFVHYFPKKLNGTQIYIYESNYKYGTLTGPHFINAHSFGYYWTMATGEYTDDEHLYECYKTGEVQNESDYTVTPPWQPCANSDSEYEKILTGMLRTVYMIQTWGHVFIKDVNYIMSCSPCDNTGGFCTCRKCSDMANNTNSRLGLQKKAGYENVWEVVNGGENTKEGYSGVYLNLTNRIAEDVTRYYEGRLSGERTEAYPDMKVMTISYEHTIPDTVRPSSNIIYMFCGQGCNNHALGSDLCTNETGIPKAWDPNNTKTTPSLLAMSEFCHESGAQLWFWVYPVTYTYVMSPCPNVIGLFNDFDWLINTCKVDGIYYEGGGATYAFEYLKSYIAAEKMARPEMTMDDFEKSCKDFLYMYYGDGYEEIYEYILLQEEAGDRAGCFTNNFSTAKSMYDFEFVAEHYEEMRSLLVSAMEGCKNDTQKTRMEKLFATCEFTGLCASYDNMYANGTEETAAIYTERCSAMIDTMIRLDMHFIGGNGGMDPANVDVTQDLYLQVYGRY